MKLSFCNLQPDADGIWIRFPIKWSPFPGTGYDGSRPKAVVTRAWSLRRSPSCKLFQAHLAHPTCENAHHTTKGSEERREEGSVQ